METCSLPSLPQTVYLDGDATMTVDSHNSAVTASFDFLCFFTCKLSRPLSADSSYWTNTYVKLGLLRNVDVLFIPGLTANRSVEITDADFAGPLSTKADKQGDIYLVLSIASVTIVALINFCLTDRVSSAVASSIDKFKAWAIHQKRD